MSGCAVVVGLRFHILDQRWGLQERMVGVTASKIAVTRPFEVITETKVMVIVCAGDVKPLQPRRINDSANVEPWSDLQVRGRKNLFSSVWGPFCSFFAAGWGDARVGGWCWCGVPRWFLCGRQSPHNCYNLWPEISRCEGAP